MDAEVDQKILIAVPNDALGGAEQYLKMVAKYFLNKGRDVLIVFLKQKKHGGWSDIENYPGSLLFYGNHDSEFRGIVGFLGKILKFKRYYFECVFTSHVHLTGLIGICRRLGQINAKYFIGRESTSIFIRFRGFKLLLFKFLYEFGYPALDLLICQTETMKHQLVNELPELSNKILIAVIPNPIDFDTIIRQSSHKIDNLRFGKYIVAAGRLIALKGFDVLIKALARINDKSLNLVILGEGIERSNLEFMIEEYQLKKRVFLLGHVPNVYPYFKDAVACVVSSRVEGFPNVLLQMMSQNDKVVSTTCAGGIESISGIFTCSPNNVDELYNALRECIAQDTSKNRELFDDFLKKRSMESFIGKICQSLQKF